jgi:C-terminal processing protease CtpA/Prc
VINIWKPALGVACAGAVAAVAIVGAGHRQSAAPEYVPPASASGAPEPAGPVVAREKTLESLAGILDREVEERLRLEEEVAELRRRLAALERGPTAAAVAAPPAEAAPAPVGGGARGEVTEANLVAAGFSEAEAAYYRRRVDEAAMARLYLRDQAQREGWLNSERYRQELAAMPNVEQQLRSEMDDTTYARYLYATGRPNQVTIRRVLAGSAAEAAGIEPGDVLLRYDGERLYDTRTVRRATRDGSAGQSVGVEILRDGRRMQLFLPRGPIGVSMGSESVLPDQNRS